MGLNSGEVVAGSVGEDLAVEYTAVGSTVGLAQRIESLAAPGGVYLTAATAALAAGYFELEDLGRMEAKGVDGLVQVFDWSGLGVPGRRSRWQQPGVSPDSSAGATS